MAKTLSDLKNSPVEKITLGFIEDAIKLTHSSFIKEKVAYNFIKKGWIDLETSNYIPALKSFNRALKIFIQKEDLKGYLLSKHGIATIYRSVSKFDKALAIYFDILDRLETEKTDLRFITLKDIAACYYDWGSYKNCLEYLKMAKEIIKNGDSIFQQIYIYYNLGKAYIKLGDLSRAQEKLFMALTLCDSNNINYKICESLTQLGNVFRKQQNYSRSESFHIRALQYAKSARDYSAHINVLINIGSLAYYSGEYKKGLQYLLTTLEEIEHVHDKYHFLLKTYHYLYVTYKELNDNKSALEYLQKSVLLKENERERLQKIHFNLLNIELKFIIKSEEFIIKKREVTEDFNSEASEELIVLLQEKIKDVIGFTNLTINTIDKFSRKINQTSIDNHQYIKSVSFNGKDSPILDSIENNREIVIYNKEMAEKDLKINISKLTKNMESFIILPIKRGQNVVAAISIEDIDKGKYTQYELNTLKTVSAYISLSIENLRIKKEVESLNALMDEDTIIIEANELSTNLP
ncbi:MAG: tetratricopeptide repeat protein, partial [Spirochaetales bacterium]|nr:tetratricopeptide repeat protein [Spirochaetales bacterium]